MSRPEIRPVETDDLAFWVEIHNRCSPTPVTVEELRAYREALAGELHLLAPAAGEPAAAAFVALEADRRSHGAALGWIGVLPEARGHGVGSTLLAALADWTLRAGLGALEGYVLEGDAPSRAWAERRGFEEVGRDSWLALDIRDLEAPAVDPPEGVELTTLASLPELARGVYEVACEAYPDIPGQEDDAMESFEDWLAHDLGGPNDDPEATFVAAAGGEVVGYSKFHLPQARPGVAVHDITGVKRAWRGRGIAGALKRAQIAWAKERGYERLETWNEERNAPIRKLNECLGYSLAPGRVLVRGALSP